MKKLFTLFIAVCTAIGSLHAGCNEDYIQVGDLYYAYYEYEATVTNTKECFGSSFQYTIQGALVIPDTITAYLGKYLVTGIRDNTFSNCTGITSVTIPSGVNDIYRSAFANCTGILSITCKAATPPTCWNNAFENVNTTIPVFVPEESIDLYKTADTWKEFSNILPISSIVEERMYPIYVHLVDSGRENYLQDAIITMDRDTALFGTWTESGEQYLVYAARVVRNQWVFMAHSTPEYRRVWWKNSEGERVVSDTLRFTATDTTDIRLVVSPIRYTIHVSSESWEKGFIRCNYAPFNHADTMFYARYWDSLRVEAVPNEGYEFKQWSDGSTYNPDYITVKGDIRLTAMFESLNCPFTGTCGDNLTWVLDCDSVLTISGTGTMTSHPWSDYHIIKDVHILDGVTSIGFAAFQGCSSLASITIPNSVTSIEYGAFMGCSNLTGITIPNSVTSIGEYAFSDCKGLTSIEIPNNVTSIGNTAFWYCTGLTSLTIGNSVTSIDSEAFAYCSNLTSVTIPNSVTSIGSSAFVFCTGLANVTIGSSVVSIGYQAFNYCTGLKSITCKAVTPPTCEGDDVFGNIDKSIPLYVPAESVEAYQGAEGWKDFMNILPIRCEGCQLVSNTLCGDQNIQWKGEWIWTGTHNDTTDNMIKVCSKDTVLRDTLINVHGNDSIVEYYFHFEPRYEVFRNDTAYEGDTLIGNPGTDYPYYEIATGDEMWINDTLSTVYGCDSMVFHYVVVLPREEKPCLIASGTCGENLTWELSCDSVLTISGRGAMKNYDTRGIVGSANKAAVRSVIIKEGVTSIGDQAFNGCSNLMSVTFSKSVTSIGYWAFAGCSMLTHIELPNSITHIGTQAFPRDVLNEPLYNANVFVSLPYSYTGDYTIPQGIKQIAGGAFEDCTGLTSVIIPDGVTSIDTYAFLGCTNLKNVEMPWSVITIGDETFNACEKLVSISIPPFVTSIGNEAFSGCTALTSITSESVEPPTCGEGVFNEVDKTIPLYVPGEAVEAYQAADGWGEFKNILPFGSTIEERMYPIYVHLVDSGRENYLQDAIITMDRDTALFGTWTESGEQYLVYAARVVRNQWVFMAHSTPEYRRVWWKNSESERVVSDTLRFTATDTTDIRLVVSPVEYTIHVSSESWEKGFIRCNYAPFNHADTMFYARYWDSLRVEAVPNEGYVFKQWSDGSTRNPNFITVKDNIELKATFRPEEVYSDTTGICNTHIRWTYDRSTKTLTIEVDENLPEPECCSGMFNDYGAYGEKIREEALHLIVKDNVKELQMGNLNMPQLTTAVIGNGVTYIGPGVFWECKNLRSVILGDSVQWIDTEAFAYCSSLQSITLPASVTQLSSKVFFECTGLTSIRCLGETPASFEYVDLDAIYAFDSTNNCPIFVPCGSLKTYLSQWYMYASRIKVDTTDSSIPCPEVECEPYIVSDTISTCAGDTLRWRNHFSITCRDNWVYDENWNYEAYGRRRSEEMRILQEDNQFYADTVRSATGCDSIFQLFIHFAPSYLLEIHDTITAGEDSVEYDWHGRRITNPEPYSDYYWTGKTINGCDSTEVLYLTVLPKEVEERMYPIFVHLVDSGRENYISDAIISMDRDTALFGTWTEEGELYLIYAYREDRNKWALTAHSTPEYRRVWWKNSESERVVSDTLRFTATDTTDIRLVVSPVEYTIHVSSESWEKGFIRCNYAPFNHADTMFYARYWDSLRVEAVPNEGYEFKQWSDGSTSNPHYLTVKNDIRLTAQFEASGCKSYFHYTPDTICSNEEVYYWRGREIYYSGKIDSVWYSENSVSYYRNGDYQVYIDSMISTEGCDSIYELRLFWAPSSKYVSYQTVDSGSYHSGQIITESGIYRTNEKNIYGCDSLAEYHLTIRSVAYVTIDTAICQGEYVRLGGMTWTSAGQHVFYSTAEDTLFTLNLTVYPRSYTERYEYIYAGEPVTYEGRVYDKPDTYRDTLINANGCDSIIITHILPSRHRVDIYSNNYNYGWAYGDSVICWPDTTTTLKAVPNDGYLFSRWSDGNTENPRFVIVKSDTAFTAIFKPIRYDIKVEANDPMLGSVRGGGSFRMNELITIMATPYKDCEFVQWSDGSSLNPRSIRVTGDSTFTAVFERETPPEPVVYSDTLFFSAADTSLLAIRVYEPSEIQAYDLFVIATVNNKQVMGGQHNHFRDTVAYHEDMNINDVSVVMAFPHDTLFRLITTDGFLTPGNSGCNAIYSDSIGADWQFVQYENVVVPQAVYYEQRMILFNEWAPRFSSYRQVTGIDRHQTSIYKLNTPRIIPVEQIEIIEDSAAWQEEEELIDTIPTEVVPQDTVAVISTAYVEFVSTFTLIVWADENHTEVLCILTFDANGKLLSVTTPNKVRRLPKSNDITFEIGDLLPQTTYFYTLMACDDDGSVLKTVNDTFTTTEQGSEDIEIVMDGESQTAKKVIINNLIYILRGDKIYTVTGQEVK